jgi:uncharacterized membrane protein
MPTNWSTTVSSSLTIAMTAYTQTSAQTTLQPISQTILNNSEPSQQKLPLSYWVALVSLFVLVGIGIATELWLAPLKPGGSWLAFKVIPYSLAIPGMIKGRAYTGQWLSMMLMLPFIESVLRLQDQGLIATMSSIQLLCTLICFISLLMWNYPKKKLAKALKNDSQQ